MNRRNFLSASVLGMAFLSISSSKLLAFTHNKLLGGGGGGNWTSIVKNFKGALTIIAKQAGVMGEVIADLAEALGLKQEAAALRAEAKNISEKGDALGADDLDAIRTKSESTQVLITERLAESTVLNAKQKAKMAEAAAKYVPAMFKSIQGGIQLVTVSSSAASAGAPGVMDGVSAATAAVDIPVLVPKAISFVSKSVEAGQKLTDIMREKDIAVPDTSGLNDAMAKMV
jgi:hypothetical protein